MKRSLLLLLALPLAGCQISIGPPVLVQKYPCPPVDAYIAAWEYARTSGCNVPVVDPEVRAAEARALEAESVTESERRIVAAEARQRAAEAELARLRARRTR